MEGQEQSLNDKRRRGPEKNQFGLDSIVTDSRPAYCETTTYGQGLDHDIVHFVVDYMARCPKVNGVDD